MNYEQAISYLTERLPMYQRVGPAAYNKSRDNIIALCNALDNPQTAYPTVHVGGTNGKGSTSSMISAVFTAAGYKVGLHTSPHLKDFTERARINGVSMERAFVADFVTKHESLLEDIKPSYFEMSVAMAFQYFAESSVDIAVIEVGLGGRLDSTNIITPIVSVVTNIGMDHMALLGDTLVAIAHEKAGIIKANIPAILGGGPPEVRTVFEQKAQQVGTTLLIAEDELRAELRSLTLAIQHFDLVSKGEIVLENLECDLGGVYQAQNVATAMLALSEIQATGDFLISETDLRKGFANVKSLSGLRGRWEVLGTHPIIIADTAHNLDGWQLVAHQLAHTPKERLHMVIGVVNDKDIAGMLALFPKNATYYWCAPDLPRALAPFELATLGAEKGLYGEVYITVNDAVKSAIAAANTDDLIFIGGSTFVVAEAL